MTDSNSNDRAPLVLSSAQPGTSVRRRNYRVLVIGGLAAAVIAGGGAAAFAASGSNSGPFAGRSGYGMGYGHPGYGYGGPDGSASSGSTPGGTQVRTPHLQGTVVSSDGTTIVITDRDGFQRTIKVTATTKYSDGLTATVAKGTVIHAEGSVDANKTTLDATSIGKASLTDHGPGRRFGPGGAGKAPSSGSSPSSSASASASPTATA